MKTTIGVDISKAHLDAHRLPDGASGRFPNDRRGVNALIEWCGRCEIERIVYEPTGAYHRVLEERLLAANLPLAKVNPLQARRFAQACGTRAKTDAVDAAVLARMGMALQPATLSPPPENQTDLKALQVARQALIKDRTAAKNRAKTLRLPLLKRQSEARLAQIARQINAIEAEMRRLIANHPQTARAFEILCSIPGVSDITAAALIVEMPELGTLDAKSAASLAGLAPMTRQSGAWNGKRFIQGGRKHLRDALYMPALVASRFNPDLKAKYHQLREAGKPAKVALTAIMRKLIILANALIRDRRTWTPKRA